MDCNGQIAKKQSMVIKSSQNPLKIFNCIFKQLKFSKVSSNCWNSQCSLKRMELSCGHNYHNQSGLCCSVVKSKLLLPVVLIIHCRLALQLQAKHIQSKPLETSKPSLTIAPEILKTIEKPLKSRVGPTKRNQWWWSNGV